MLSLLKSPITSEMSTWTACSGLLVCNALQLAGVHRKEVDLIATSIITPGYSRHPDLPSDARRTSLVAKASDRNASKKGRSGQCATSVEWCAF